MSRPVLVLVATASYFVIAFALRSWLQHRRTGSTGFRGISGRPLSLEWTGGVSFVVALVAIVAAPILLMVGVDRLLFAPSRLTDVVGAIAAGGGLLALLWSQSAMGTSWRIGVDAREVTPLVTGGPFDVVRNPIFSALLLSGTGLVLLLPTACALAAFVMFVLAVELQVRFVEEPYLVRAHGEAYREYAGRVGRFVPGLGKRLSP